MYTIWLESGEFWGEFGFKSQKELMRKIWDKVGPAKFNVDLFLDGFIETNFATDVGIPEFSMYHQDQNTNGRTLRQWLDHQEVPSE